MDPVTSLRGAALAGIEQAADGFRDMGGVPKAMPSGLEHLYADDMNGTFLGSARFPSLLKQPNYSSTLGGTLQAVSHVSTIQQATILEPDYSSKTHL